MINEWEPKTKIGRMVKEGRIKSIEEIFEKGLRITEPEIVDTLLPELDKDFILIGQARGKFGGGARRLFKQTQKKTAEGNKPKFTTMIIVGNQDGYIGTGRGSAKETLPAREKATKRAKMNLFKIKRGCGSWQCGCTEPHSIPITVKGRCGSVRITLLPAPKGVGLCVHSELRKILSLAGIKDVWSRIEGQSRSRINLTLACTHALKKLMKTRMKKEYIKHAGVVEGKTK